KSMLVALDENGDNIDSTAFARHLGSWRDQSAANTIFLIGGADGLSPDLRCRAKLKLAFGSATWPHQMVRVMLLEQIYRAATILAGHASARAGAHGVVNTESADQTGCDQRGTIIHPLTRPVGLGRQRPRFRFRSC